MGKSKKDKNPINNESPAKKAENWKEQSTVAGSPRVEDINEINPKHVFENNSHLLDPWSHFNNLKRYYRKLKYRDIWYTWGDDVYAKDNDGWVYYGKIIKIYPSWDDEGYEEISHDPWLEIKW